MKDIPTIPKDIVKRRLENSLKESKDFINRAFPEMFKDYSYCLSFLRQILQQKFDMDLNPEIDND
jgi:hypothetical protein